MAIIRAARVACTENGLDVWCEEALDHPLFFMGVLKVADLNMAAVDAALAQIAADHVADLNLVNQPFSVALGDKWQEARGVIFKWIIAHPTATAVQAQMAFNTAFPNSPFSAAQLFALMQERFGFASWAALRDYVVANAASIREERG